MDEVIGQALRTGWSGEQRAMHTPDDVQAMLKLAALGWGAKRIAREMGCSRNTVRRYLRAGGYVPYRSPARSGRLDGLGSWLAVRYLQHRGNADVVRQDLRRELGIKVSLRTVERAVRHLRREVMAQSRSTVRFETAPAQQLQIDFGSLQVPICDESRRIFLFVATLGYSRRTFVEVFLHERQSAWITGIEGAFRYFGGVTQELLLDNAKPLVYKHNVQTREIIFNERFRSFCKYWGVTPRACAPYRARTKGKDERGVGYVKRNAIAGHGFASLEAVRGHLALWMREVADVRNHGTTGEPPIVRFDRDERAVLIPVNARAAFLQVRELVRCVHSDACIELDTNRYSVPWRLIGESVTVVVADPQVRILYAGHEVACHAQSLARRTSVIDRKHLVGIVGAGERSGSVPPMSSIREIKEAELLRPLSEYEKALGGAW
jgi:transposase